MNYKTLQTLNKLYINQLAVSKPREILIPDVLRPIPSDSTQILYKLHPTELQNYTMLCTLFIITILCEILKLYSTLYKLYINFSPNDSGVRSI